MALDEQFWSGEREQLLRILLPEITSSAVSGAESALSDLLAEAGVGVDWGLVNDEVAEWARRYSAGLVRDITDTTRQFTQKAVAAWVESAQPLDELIDLLEPTFGKTRAELIASTEVTRAFHEGNTRSWEASGVVDGWRFRTAVDDAVCPICGPLEGAEYALSDQSDAPPLHPRCRCWSQPIVNVP